MANDMQFNEWLKFQLNREDVIGDLARDALSDNRWPHGNNAQLETYCAHLSMLGAKSRILSVLRRAWYEWKGRDLPPVAKKLYAFFWMRAIRLQENYEEPPQISILYEPALLATRLDTTAVLLDEAAKYLIGGKWITKLPAGSFVGSFISFGDPHKGGYFKPFLVFTPDDYDYWSKHYGNDYLPAQVRAVAGKARHKSEAGYIYVIRAIGSNRFKIGRAKDIEQRLKQLSTGTPFPLEIIATIHSDDYKRLESDLHQQFDQKRRHNEWFELDDFDLAYLERLATAH